MVLRVGSVLEADVPEYFVSENMISLSELHKLSRERFSTLEELIKRLPKGIYISDRIRVELNEIKALPFAINNLDLCMTNQRKEYLVGIIYGEPYS